MRITKLKQSGFTLVELLIVIVIIGILAAIAFVAYSGTQNKAHKADAESTLASVKNKLAEYNTGNSNYPANQADLNTWMASSAGGNNAAMSAKFVSGNGYSYTPSPSGCDNETTPCSGFTITAAKSIFKGDADITVTN